MNQLLAALRAAGEATRIRIIAALKQGELTVSELTRVLDQSQPRVSRHLKLLCDAGLLERYQEGAWVFHRITDQPGTAEIAKSLLKMIDFSDPTLARDQVKLSEIREEKTQQAAAYFSSHAEEWDSIRARMVPDAAIEAHLIDRARAQDNALFLDLGTGTGRILEILAPHVDKGIGFDLNREMLNVARSNLENAEIDNCSVRLKDIHNIGMEDHCADLISIHQVLHYVDHPERVIREAARLLKPGGQLLIVDFLPHDLEFLRELHAHQRLGFSEQTISQWCGKYHLKITHHQALRADKSNQDTQTLTAGLWSAQAL